MKDERRNSNFSKKSTEANTKGYLSSVAANLKGKDLFPEKVEKAKQFFKKLELA